MARIDINRVPVPAGDRGADRLGVTWVGHASVLLELGGVRLLTDPVLGRRVGFLQRVAGPVPSGLAHGVDAVLLSHAHADHVDPRSLRSVGPTVPIVAPHAVAGWLGARGFTGVREVTAGSSVRIGRATIEATPARHDGRRWPRGPAAEAVGFLVQAEQSVYFAGDTDLFPEMAALGGRVDVALLPIWGWGPTLGPGHLDPERAAEALTVIRPRVAIPIHWGTLARPGRRPGEHALTRPARAFAAAAARLAPDVEVRVLSPGDSTALAPGEGVVRAPRR